MPSSLYSKQKLSVKSLVKGVLEATQSICISPSPSLAGPEVVPEYRL